VLAQEIETKEQLALLVVQPLLFALDVSVLVSCCSPAQLSFTSLDVSHLLQTCQEEANVMLNGLKLMYNLCYR